jgi:endonuclease YncB( thermonuclease family)
LSEPISPGAVQVIDGDTIRVGRIVYRLVGFDTPEVGFRATCERAVRSDPLQRAF